MESRLDAVAKAVARGATRRQALRLAGGGLVGALLAAGLGTVPGRVSADEALKPLGKKCNKDAQCASGVCDRATAKCADPNACPARSTCGSFCSPPEQGGVCYPTPNIVTCGAEPGCSCQETTERTTACVGGRVGILGCRSSSECGDGEACVFEPCQTVRQAGSCAPLCGQGG